MTVDEIDDLLTSAPVGPTKPATVISEGDLATLLDLTPRRVRELRQEGVIPGAGRARYVRDEAVRAYVQWLRSLVTGKAPNLDAEIKAEKLRTERERADKLAAQNAAARRELVPAAEVEGAWSLILRRVRAEMLAVPSRLGTRLPHLSPRDLSEIDLEIRDALGEAADGG